MKGRESICLLDPQMIQANYTKNTYTTSSSNNSSWSFLVNDIATQSSFIQDKDKNTSFNNIQCQICMKMRHFAVKCYFRYSQFKNNCPSNNRKPKNLFNKYLLFLLHMMLILSHKAF